MVSADEVARSLRGASAILNRRSEGLAAFGTDDESFWRSFKAFGLTIPALVVALALTRNGLGLGYSGDDLLASPQLAAGVALAHFAGLVIGPAVMVSVAVPLGLVARIPGFVVVTNWLAVFASLLLAVPGALLLGGLATPGLAALDTVAFAAIVLHGQWYAARLTLGLGPVTAAVVAGAGYALAQVPLGLLGVLITSG